MFVVVRKEDDVSYYTKVCSCLDYESAIERAEQCKQDEVLVVAKPKDILKMSSRTFSEEDLDIVTIIYGQEEGDTWT